MQAQREKRETEYFAITKFHLIWVVKHAVVSLAAFQTATELVYLVGCLLKTSKTFSVI